jgi:hypothetical protein
MEKESRRCRPGQYLANRESWPILRPDPQGSLAFDQPLSRGLLVVAEFLSDLDMSGDGESGTHFEVGSYYLMLVSKVPLDFGNQIVAARSLGSPYALEGASGVLMLEAFRSLAKDCTLPERKVQIGVAVGLEQDQNLFAEHIEMAVASMKTGNIQAVAPCLTVENCSHVTLARCDIVRNPVWSYSQDVASIPNTYNRRHNDNHAALRHH